jgi:hypothetical protein
MGMYHISRTERHLGPKARQNRSWLCDEHTLSKLCHVSTPTRTTAWPLPVRTQQPSKGSELHIDTARLHSLSIPDLLNPTLDTIPVTSARKRFGSVSIPDFRSSQRRNTGDRIVLLDHSLERWNGEYDSSITNRNASEPKYYKRLTVRERLGNRAAQQAKRISKKHFY